MRGKHRLCSKQSLHVFCQTPFDDKQHGSVFQIAKSRRDCAFNFYRPQTKFAKVMFFHLSVSHAGMHPPDKRQTPSSRDHRQAPHGTRRSHPPRDQRQAPPQEQCMLGDTGNKRAIRILLECILVIILLILEFHEINLLIKFTIPI